MHPFLAQADELIKQVTAAADKSDHWLFLFVLALFAFCGGVTVRVLWGMWDKSETRYNTYVEKDRTETIKLFAQLNSALEDSTQANKAAVDMLRRIEIKLDGEK